MYLYFYLSVRFHASRYTFPSANMSKKQVNMSNEADMCLRAFARVRDSSQEAAIEKIVATIRGNIPLCFTLKVLSDFLHRVTSTFYV